jgi:hypothetical protein
VMLGGGGGGRRGMDVLADNGSPVAADMEAGKAMPERLRFGRPEVPSDEPLSTSVGNGGGRVPVKEADKELLSTGSEGCIGEGRGPRSAGPPPVLQSSAPAPAKREASASQSDSEALRGAAVRARFSSPMRGGYTVLVTQEARKQMSSPTADARSTECYQIRGTYQNRHLARVASKKTLATSVRDKV